MTTPDHEGYHERLAMRWPSYVQWAETIEQSARQTCEPAATELRRVAAALRKLAESEPLRTNQRSEQR